MPSKHCINDGVVQHCQCNPHFFMIWITLVKWCVWRGEERIFPSVPSRAVMAWPCAPRPASVWWSCQHKLGLINNHRRKGGAFKLDQSSRPETSPHIWDVQYACNGSKVAQPWDTVSSQQDARMGHQESSPLFSLSPYWHQKNYVMT